MLDKLQQLEWEQKNDRSIVIHINDNNNKIGFAIDNSLVNYIVSNIPKYLYIYIELANNKEQVYFVDFDGIMSKIPTQNKLVVKISDKFGRTSKKTNKKSKGKYSLARGESYPNRFLSDKGWQKQRKYFDLFDINDFTTEKITKPKQVETPTKVKKASSKLKECIACGEIIPSKVDICPYCKYNQNEDESFMDISI